MSNNKYIRVLSKTVFVRIARGKNVISKHFTIRDYPSLEECLDDARKWRDAEHLLHFGCPVTESIKQLSKKKQSHSKDDRSSLPELPPRLSYGFSRGQLRYIVVSHQENKAPVRTRIPIQNEDLDSAIKSAIEIDKNNP